MLKVRGLTPNDMKFVREIYDRHYSHEFRFPDFMTNFLNAFVVTGDEDEIILAGGVRAIAETIIVTDKDHPSKIKLGRALVEAQKVSIFTCQKFGLEWLHAFIKDEQYAKHLLQHGFSPRCQALSMKVSNGRR